MRLTQGCFSFLPDLTDEQIRAQIAYCIDRGYAINLEYTDDPHPRNTYWQMWDLPMFDIKDPAGVMVELDACRAAHGASAYVRLSGFDASPGWESVRISFIVSRPPNEPGFRLIRTAGPGRMQRYSLQSYAGDRPEGERY